MKRPGLGPYLTDPNLMATYDGIIASALDRLGRNARHLIELKDWAAANRKTLILISPSLKWPIEDANDFGGRMVWTILGELAEYELQAITKRNRETQKWLMENGFLHGKPPFGFNVVDKGNHKTLEPDTALKPVIREMAERYLAGASFTDLAEWLDSIGVKPPSSKRWAQNSLRRYMSNPVLIGRRKDASGRTILKFDPILDDDTFRRVQVALGERATRKAAPMTSPCCQALSAAPGAAGPCPITRRTTSAQTARRSTRTTTAATGRTASRPGAGTWSR